MLCRVIPNSLSVSNFSPSRQAPRERYSHTSARLVVTLKYTYIVYTVVVIAVVYIVVVIAVIYIVVVIAVIYIVVVIAVVYKKKRR